MTEVRNLRYPTTQMLMFLNLLYFKKVCTFKNQDIYKDQAHFRKVIRDLLKWNVISEKKIIENNRFIKAYVLNGNGTILIEEFIYDFHKCVTKQQ